MAAQAAIQWRQDRVEAPEESVAPCPEEVAVWSRGRRLAAALVAGAACLLVAAPAIVGLVSMVGPDSVAGWLAWFQGVPAALAALAVWRVPAAIILVLGVAGLRRNR
jgi:hypothetical protein